jgi:hypothetical protein
MSRSNQEETMVNPAKRWFKWSGKDGCITYYDKELKENVPVKMPFTFLLLDELTTITGFSEAEDKGIYSNEVKFTNSEKLNVRCGKNTLELGLYADIKDAIKAKGGKYSRSCYIVFKDDNGNYEIGNFLMAGSALSGGDHKEKGAKEKKKLDGWMDFMNTNKNVIYKSAVKMDLEPRVCQKGSNEYRIPKFTLVEVSEETNQIATALDADLQAFLSIYLKKSHKEETPSETTEYKSKENEAPKNHTEELKATYGEPKTQDDFTKEFEPTDNQEDNEELPF